MARLLACLVPVLAASANATSASIASAGKALDEVRGHDTPITRVVNLLKEMSQTLEKEMEEDESMYKEISCWCSEGKHEKKLAIEASKTKIEELQSSIEMKTAKSSELSTSIKELEEGLAADKQALAESTALRKKEASEFHGGELDSVQALENLKAAIEVLSKHHGAPPDSTVAGGAIFKSERDRWSFLATKTKTMPWLQDKGQRALDQFMSENGYVGSAVLEKTVKPHRFLQQAAPQPAVDAWSDDDLSTVDRAMKSVSAFVQARHGSDYMPAYQSQSGEILGVLKQLKEEMEADLAESQKQEQGQAGNFADLRGAKSSQVASADKMSEQKEDELAQTDNALAEAKEDFDQEQKVLAENQKYLKNLEETCATREANFNERKKSRQREMQAVAETIEILHGDEARDAMSSTYNSFVQIASERGQNQRRTRAAAGLRQVAAKLRAPELSVLATSVELDAFSKVKAAIDQMIIHLKQEQSDEVKKHDWCNEEFHKNEMDTSKQQSRQADLEAKIAQLDDNINKLTSDIKTSRAEISQLQLELQRASEDRKKENMEFQKAVADQTVTEKVLHKALDRLATYYDFLQLGTKATSTERQTPPVPEMEYKASKSSTGVMEMIEKLIHDTVELRDESRKAENSAQVAYEQLVADTNGSVQALQTEVVTKTKDKTQTEKDRLATNSDLDDTLRELDGLAKYNSDLHQDCDYLISNFDLRQNKRGEEVEALQQAKQILSGASLSEAQAADQ